MLLSISRYTDVGDVRVLSCLNAILNTQCVILEPLCYDIEVRNYSELG